MHITKTHSITSIINFEYSLTVVPVLAITASTTRGALLSVLVAFTIFFCTSAFYAITSKFFLLDGACSVFAVLAILTACAAASFPAGFTCSIALAIFGLTIGLDASAFDPAFGRHPFKEVINFAVL